MDDPNYFYCTGKADKPNNCNRVRTCWNPSRGQKADVKCSKFEWQCSVRKEKGGGGVREFRGFKFLNEF